MMNAPTKRRRLAQSLILIALFAYPAAAQESFVFESDDGVNVAQFASLNSIVADVRAVEHLPLVPPALSVTQWLEYGGRLETALASGHKGLQHSVLRLIIAYGDHFDLSDQAVFDVMRIYRDGDTERVRRMAVVALAQMESDWAMKFLERSVRFEKSDAVSYTIRSILNEREMRLTSL